MSFSGAAEKKKHLWERGRKLSLFFLSLPPLPAIALGRRIKWKAFARDQKTLTLIDSLSLWGLVGFAHQLADRVFDESKGQHRGAGYLFLATRIVSANYYNV